MLSKGRSLNSRAFARAIPDLVFLWGGLYGLELKKPGGVLSPAQRLMHPRLLAAGMVACATCDSLEGARETLRRWGLIHC